jgi:hypothetical protein
LERGADEPNEHGKAPLIMSQCGNSMFASPTRDECILAAKASHLEFLFFGAGPFSLLAAAFSWPPGFGK